MESNDPLWDIIVDEARSASLKEPMLEDFFRASILDQPDLESAMSFNLAQLLASPAMAVHKMAEVIAEALAADSRIGKAIRSDIRASFERDAACDLHLTPILYYKGFQALQLQRVAHWLWGQGRKPLALFIQNQVSETFAVDIHPGAQMGSGIMLDHAQICAMHGVGGCANYVERSVAVQFSQNRKFDVVFKVARQTTNS